MNHARWFLILIAACACTPLATSDAQAVTLKAIAKVKKCHVKAHSYVEEIKAGAGRQGPAMIRVYKSEGLNCYVGDHGSSFGPFQLHFDGMADVFRHQTGLNARNPKTVGSQIGFMRRWGNAHGGYSSTIWHGLRAHHTRHRWG